MSGKLREPIIFQTTFSTYTASAILGEGGAGRVYEVLDEQGQLFAIKTIDPDKATREKLKRFKNELFFCLRNQHPNIIVVKDHGVRRVDDGNSPFYVMPLYRETLRGIMSKGIAPEKALVYFGQILDGVEAAHLRKVFHRDLKPENILFDRENDRLVVADFGIAHFAEDELATVVETTPLARLANFRYAAPEQRSPKQQVDHRADIFALGLILNEMFTKEVPQGTEYRSIGGVQPQYAYLDEMVAAMMRQAPKDRPAAIEEIKQQLIGRKNEFITRQRLSKLQDTVIPSTDIDDPLVTDPVHLIGFDWDRDKLTLQLSQPVNEKWVWALRNMGNYSWIDGGEPERFKIRGDRALIDAPERKVQAIINHFKEWLPNANRVYEQQIRREKREAERQAREKLQREIEAEEGRQRVLKNVRI